MTGYDDQRCATCVFWDRGGPQLAGAERDPSCPAHLGTCHFAPPTVAPATGFFPLTVWPRTHEDRWCGGWEQAAEGGPNDGEQVGVGEPLETVITPFRRKAA